jgi:hypothetical protein
MLQLVILSNSGCVGLLHHNCNMLNEFFYVCIASHLIEGVKLLYLEFDQDPPPPHPPPLYTIDNAIGYVVSWP